MHRIGCIGVQTCVYKVCTFIYTCTQTFARALLDDLPGGATIHSNGQTALPSSSNSKYFYHYCH